MIVVPIRRNSKKGVKINKPRIIIEEPDSETKIYFNSVLQIVEYEKIRVQKKTVHRILKFPELNI